MAGRRAGDPVRKGTKAPIPICESTSDWTVPGREPQVSRILDRVNLIAGDSQRHVNITSRRSASSRSATRFSEPRSTAQWHAPTPGYDHNRNLLQAGQSNDWTAASAQYG